MPCTCETCRRESRGITRSFRDVMRSAAIALAQNTDAPRHRTAAEVRAYMERRGLTLCPTCGGDPARCGCWECTDCHAHFPRTARRCDVCGSCDACCECNRCESCGSAVSDDNWCGECNRCNGCCRCDEVPFRDQDRNAFHGEPSERYPRFLGVEIECAAQNRKWSPLKAAAERWGFGIHDDGSISDSLGSTMELSTAPARGDAFVSQIKDVTDALETCGARVDRSCGLHVHVDVRNFAAREVLALARLYARIEPALFSIVPPSRRSNHYAKAWGDTFERCEVFDTGSCTERAERLDAAIYGSVEQAKRVKESPYKHDSRYHALNWNALVLYGTIEFRLHSGTVDARKILMWSAVCSAIVNYAAKHGEGGIRRLSGSAWEVLSKVVEDREVKDWLKNRRDHFQNAERKARGLPVSGRPRRVDVSPVERGEEAA